MNIYLGLRPREIFLPWVQYLSIFHAKGWNIYNIYMYIRIAFSIELRLRVSRSLCSLANYRPSPLAQKPSNGVLACGDPITPSNMVKYHPSSNTLISTEQRGGVRNKYIYIYMYIRIAFSIELRLRVSRSLRSLANYRYSTRKGGIFILLETETYSTIMASELDQHNYEL